MQESLRALNLAHRAEQAGAAVAVVALRAKINGLLVDRKEIGGPGAFAHLSDEELQARLMTLVARLGLAPPDPNRVIDLEPDQAEPAAREAESAMNRVRRRLP
jgi:hypothetical protein